MTGALGRLCPPVFLVLALFLFFVPHVQADDVAVCSMPRNDFVDAAFPDTDLTNFYRGMLLKRARTPGLIVLVPGERVSAGSQIETVFGRIAEDRVLPPSRSSLLAFKDFEDLEKIVGQLGNDNVFVIVAESPTNPQDVRHFRRALEQVVYGRREVDALVARSKQPGGFTTRSRVNLETAEVLATAIVMSPQNEDGQIGLMIYLAYYAAISLNASSTDSFLSRFFEKPWSTDAELTDFGRQYFSIFADDRVKNGATKDSFVECTE